MTEIRPGEKLRRWPRHRIDVRLKVLFSEGGTEKSAFGRGNNLSYGGMGAYIPCAIPLGASVLLDVGFLYSPLAVTVKAVIRNCEGFRYGLEFQEISDHVRTVIAKNSEAAGVDE
jgi:hypothetical protein